MSILKLHLFKKTEMDGTIARYSLLIELTFDYYGNNLVLPEGGWSGQLDTLTDTFSISLSTLNSLEDGEIEVAVIHTRTNLREIDGISLSNPPGTIEVEVTLEGGTKVKGSVAIADAEEEEAKPISINYVVS